MMVDPLHPPSIRQPKRLDEESEENDAVTLFMKHKVTQLTPHH